MTRRRHSRVLASLAAIGLAGVVSMGTLAAAARHPGALQRSLTMVRVVTRLCARPIEHLVAPAVAMADDVLEFKSVPRESTRKFERMRVTRKTPAPDPTDTMMFDRADVPDVPEAPEPPEPPDLVLNKSGGIMKIGSDIHVGRDEVVHGDLSAVNGDITIEGHVEGDVVAMKGDVELKSTARVDGDVVCLGGTLEEEPGAQVGGQKVTAPGSGSWNIRDVRHGRRHFEGGDGVAAALVWLLMLALFGWLLSRFAPGRTRAAAETLMRSPGLSLGIGSTVLALIIPSIIALALVVALLCITIIGIPLALAALVGYVLFLALLGIWGFVVAAIVVGGALSKAQHAVAMAPAAPALATAEGGSLPGVAPPPVSSAAAPASQMRAMLIGLGVLMGSIVLGRLLRATDLGPLHGLGTLIFVLGVIASSFATTFGAGAVMRTAIVMGTFQRIWSGRRYVGWRGTQAPGAPAAAPPAGGPPPGSAPVAPWPPPPPHHPSPPAAFMPQDPGAGGQAPPPGASETQPPLG